MRKSTVSGIIVLGVTAIGGIAMADMAQPKLPVVAGAKALTQAEKAGVFGDCGCSTGGSHHGTHHGSHHASHKSHKSHHGSHHGSHHH